MALYHELISNLRDNIKSMRLGEKLPSERQLCLDYDVSRTTVRSAISQLELEGYVSRIQGKGTFASRPKTKRQNLSNYYSFTEQTRKLGKVPKTILVEYHIEMANNYIKDKMKLNDGEMIIRLVRIRIADDEKLMLETSYLPYERFSEVTKKLLDTLPLYEIFEKKYNIKIDKVNEVFSVAKVRSEDADLLEIPNETPVLKINRISYDVDGNIIEYTISIARGDKFNYETTYQPN